MILLFPLPSDNVQRLYQPYHPPIYKNSNTNPLTYILFGVTLVDIKPQFSAGYYNLEHLPLQ